VEFAALNTAVQGQASGGLVLLRGPAGIGKSALLTSAAMTWPADGTLVINVDTKAEPGQFGLAAFAAAIRDRFDEIGGAHLLDATGWLGRAVTRVAHDGPNDPGATVDGLAALASLARTLAGRGRTIFVIDDVEHIAAPSMVIDAATRAGCVVVATARGEFATGLARGAVIDLGPMPPAMLHTMLRQRCGSPIDEGLLSALAAGLGSWAGHPATVVTTVDELGRSGRLTQAGRRSRSHLCLVDPEKPIPLAATDPLMAHVGSRATRRLVTAVAVLGMGLDDLPLLAEATCSDLSAYERAVDDLVAIGLLSVRGDSVQLTCPAVATRLAADYQPRAVARLHRACAAAMLRRTGLGRPGDPAALADHVMAAGDTMPRGRYAAAGLTHAASTTAERDPVRAARWLLAALRHDSGDPATTHMMEGLIRALVRTASYEWLAEVAEAACSTTRPLSSNVADAALLAALHLGCPLSKATERTLRPEALAVAEWWFGRPPPEGIVRRQIHSAVDEPLLLSAEWGVLADTLGAWNVGIPSTQPNEALGRLDDDALWAGSVGDLAGLLASLLGSRYGRPDRGPLATYHRLVTAFREADAAAVLSAGRALELGRSLSTPVQVMARFLAAEVHSMRGELPAFLDCLDGVPKAAPYLGMWWWVTAGVNTAGDGLSTLRAGARALADTAGAGMGTELVLGRMVEIAAWSPDPGAAVILAQAAEAANHPERRITKVLSLLLTAVTQGDPASAELAAEFARAGGDKPRLVTSCLAAAAVIARAGGDPAPWLHEVYDAVNTMCAPALRLRVSNLLRAHGLRPPRSAPRPDFSAVETEIITLIRGGWTNRQIAARVRMSEKTVEGYLTRLYARTGCRSRVELATARLSLGGQQ
jgi:DNA-binding CsgD family transcriptional regulator